MARDGDRRGANVPRRSPQELAETLASLAATTPDPPPPRPRRPVPGADQWPETFPDQSDQVTPDTSPTAGRAVTLTPEQAQTPDEAARAPAPASGASAPAFEVPSAASEARAPASEFPSPASEARAPASEFPSPASEARAPASDAAALPQRSRPSVSNGSPARPSLRSRTRGRVWQRGLPSRRGRALRTTGWRRSRTTGSTRTRAKPGSRNLRGLYPPLIVLLVIVVVIGLVDRGGGGSSKTSAPTASAPRSVFPTPSPVPAATPPPVAVPAPAPKPQPIATEPRSCRPVHVHGRTVTVSILQGQVICRNARAVVRAFKSGKGRRHGSPGHQYVTVRGWRCVSSGACTRPGKSIKAS